MPEISQLINLGGWGFCAFTFWYVGRWVVRRIVDPLMDSLQKYFADTGESMKRLAGSSEANTNSLETLHQKFDALHTDVKRVLPPQTIK